MPEFWSSFADRGLPQQYRQLGDVGGDAPSFIAGEQGWVSEMRDRGAEVQCP